MTVGSQSSQPQAMDDDGAAVAPLADSVSDRGLRWAERLAVALCTAVAVAAVLGLGPLAVAIVGLPIAAWIAYRFPLLPIWALSLEMALGGWGHAFDVRGVPVRHALLVVVMATWVFRKLAAGDWQLRGARFAVAPALFLGFVSVAVLVSVANRHPFAVEDGMTALFLLLVFPMIDIAAAPGGIHRLLRCFVLSVLVLSLVQITLTMGIFVGVIDGHWLALVFDRVFGGVVQIAGPFWRVFIVGSIFFQVSLLILAAGLLAGRPLLGTTGDLLVLGTTSLSLIFTYTRGFWATALIGVAVLAVLTSPRGRVRGAVVVLAAILAATIVLPSTDLTLVDVVIQRVVQTFDPDRDVSVALRLDLYPRLLARFVERPVLGFGFGVLVEKQLYYENSYFYYGIKFGLVGLAFLALSWAVVLIDGVRTARHHQDATARALAAGMTAAIVSMLTVTAINPFINSAPGLYFQALATAVIFGLARTRVGGAPGPGAAAPQPTGGR